MIKRYTINLSIWAALIAAPITNHPLLKNLVFAYSGLAAFIALGCMCAKHRVAEKGKIPAWISNTCWAASIISLSAHGWFWCASAIGLMIAAAFNNQKLPEEEVTQ